MTLNVQESADKALGGDSECTSRRSYKDAPSSPPTDQDLEFPSVRTKVRKSTDMRYRAALLTLFGPE